MRREVLSSVALLAFVWIAPGGLAHAGGPGLGSVTCDPGEMFKPIHIFDHSNGTPDDGAFGHNVSIMVDGYLMLLFAWDSGGPNGGLLFYDVSDPRHPELVRTVRDDSTEDLRETHSLPVAAANGHRYLAVQTAHGVQFWNIDTAMDAHAIATLPLDGVNGGDYEDVAWQLAWQWPYLFVAGGNLGFFVIDTSDPAHPQVVKRVPTSQTGGFRVGPIFAAGDYLVVSNMDQDGQYGLLDVSDAHAPGLIATLGGLPKIYSMSVLGDRIYGAGRDGELLIHSFGAEGLTEVSRSGVPGDGLYISIQDGFVHYGLTDSYKKVDIRDEHQPVEIAEGFLGVEHGDHGQTTPYGNLVFIGNDHGTGSAFLCHQGERDEQPPEVVKIYPVDGSTRQSLTSRVSVAFSDNIDFRSVGPGTLIVREAGGPVLAGGYSYVFNTVAFGPDGGFKANTTYEIVLTDGGVKDMVGNAFAGEVVSRFSTGDMVTIPEPEDPDAGPTLPGASDAQVPGGVDEPVAGGCGCRAASARGQAGAGALLVLVGAALLSLRARRRSDA